MAAWLKALVTWKCGILLLFIFLEIFCAGNATKWFRNIAGPYRLDIKLVEKCPPGVEGPVKVDWHYRDVIRRNRSRQYRVIDLNVTMPFYLSDQLSGRGVIASWSSMGGWKDNAHIINAPKSCQAFNFWSPKIYHNFLKSIFGEIVPCPLFPMIAHAVNYTISWDDLPVKQLFYGKYRGDFHMLGSDGVVVGCVRGYADAIPK